MQLGSKSAKRAVRDPNERRRASAIAHAIAHAIAARERPPLHSDVLLPQAKGRDRV